ncbi:DNA mismatch repair endonuclease MutL [Gaopeijia maritima]|uniref:DNA mismatch repair protein MutL n=1 Tax=Gaopeijia maritima TaxID=3119007 RepID=A0ABU9E6S2_9BACT
MSRRIRVLPDAVANQIAAGEVVERPASVVKELVENALDAGATRIDVEIESGGKRRIRVADDGHGMERADAILSLDRHATSKIQSPEDLRGIASFGFRGEALPSIAAVSRLRLETRGDDEVGTLIRSTGGRILEVVDHARRRGTTIEVQTLFFNAPARSRFLKSSAAEARAVSETLTSLALAHREATLRLVSGDRTLLDLPGTDDPRERVAALWGDDAAESLIPVYLPLGGTVVSGLVQRPDAARPGVRRAHLFVGSRPFREPALLRAAERGYRTTIPQGVRPWIFLHLDVPAGSVDVNVHPAKAEVRFRDRAAVEEAVEAAVRAALSEAASAAPLGRSAPIEAPVVRERPRESTPPPSRPAAGRGTDQMALFVSAPAPSDAPASSSSASSDEDDRETPATPSAVEPLEMGRPRLTQYHRQWIVAEAREGLLIIDQHAAHERVLFERLMRSWGEGGADAQRLLFPLTLRLTPEEIHEVEQVKNLLARAGFEIDLFGSDTVIVHTVPDPHPWFDAERCVREMIAELTEGTSDLMRAARNQHERIAMTFACKGAIKAGQLLSDAEMHELFDALFATELPWHDVHGRPTVVRLSNAELERKFGR